MKVVVVAAWRDFQHYDPAKRTPPWIKSYVAQLDPTVHPKFTALSDGAKLTLHHLRLLAATCKNRIPLQWINKAHLNMCTNPKLKELEDAGLVASMDDSDIDSINAFEGAISTPLARTSGSLDSLLWDNQNLTEGEESKPQRGVLAKSPAEAFDSIWKNILEKPIPEPVGKKDAQRHYLASVLSPADAADCLTALENYRGSDRVKNGYVQNASTWFNNWRDWIDRRSAPVNRFQAAPMPSGVSE